VSVAPIVRFVVPRNLLTSPSVQQSGMSRSSIRSEGHATAPRSTFSLATFAAMVALLTSPIVVSAAPSSGKVPSSTNAVSPGNCTVPGGILLVGMKNGVADPAGSFNVVIRDGSNDPMPNVTVELDLTDTPDLRLSNTQPHPGLTATNCRKVSAQTDALGSATFIVVGSAAGRYTSPGTVGANAKLRADGVLVASVPAAAFDQDGLNGIDWKDLYLWKCDFGSSSQYSRSDYDFIGGVAANDLGVFLARMSAGNSVESGSYCPADGSPPAAELVTGGLGLGWDDCRANNADKFSNCLSNTGSSFHLISSLQPNVDLADVKSIEAVIDIVNPAGPLPAWWRFESGGCRVASRSFQDPNNNPSITCTLSGAFQESDLLVQYPHEGNPNVERILVSTTLSGGATLLSSDKNALLDLAINRAKSTGAGSCAGCDVPVQVILRSIRVVRRDVCAQSPVGGIADVVYSQPSGSNVARWQSSTPGFPITIDATALTQITQFKINGAVCLESNVPQSITSPDGECEFAACLGTCPSFTAEKLHFGVDTNGHITYDPILEGAFTGAGTSTLTIKSFSFPPVGDDVAPSMGQFRVVVEPRFWQMMSSYPGFAVVNGVHRLVSPVLNDRNTLIGRSSIHRDGDAGDISGLPVGTAGTIISDANFALSPPGFQGPAGTQEIHTEVRSLNMTEGPVAVRAGTFAPSRPICAGEIQAFPNAEEGLFPGDSFFNMFVEVDLPLLGTLYNTDPLMVENSGVDCFPPRVVYLHKHTGPVMMKFKADDTQPVKRWLAGDNFGWLVLAGHGINFDSAGVAPADGRTGARSTNVDPFAEFLALVNAEPEMADTATLVVDVQDVLEFSPPSAYLQPQFRDSLENGIALAAALGKAGNPCAALFEANRMYQRVDSLPPATDWVVDHAVRRILANRIQGLSAQLLAQANQSGGCNATTDAPPMTPGRLALLGITPNPTSGESTIRYALPASDRVNLSVYDVTGRHVRTLVDGKLPAGSYQAVWDGHQDRASGRLVKSGTYFIRLTAAGRVETKRVVIVR